MHDAFPSVQVLGFSTDNAADISGDNERCDDYSSALAEGTEREKDKFIGISRGGEGERERRGEERERDGRGE